MFETLPGPYTTFIGVFLVCILALTMLAAMAWGVLLIVWPRFRDTDHDIEDRHLISVS